MPEPIALVIASYPESLTVFRGDLLRDLRAQGFAVHVVAPGLQASPAVTAILRGWGVHCHDIAFARTGTNPFADALLLWRLYRLQRRLRPALMLAYTIKPVVYGLLAAWLARVPRRYALITGLGYAFADGRGGLARIARGLYRAALRRADAVFFQNPDDQALFAGEGLLAPGQRTQVVAGSGVDVDHFAPAPLPAGPPVFLLIARLLVAKGVREYAAAAARVRARHPQARFRLAGWIDDNPDAIAAGELEAWIAAGTLEFLGRLDDVRGAVADCTVYVLPSYREGTPRTVLEAMAMGRPVITTDAPGCRETVIDGENGVLVALRSVDALEAAMLEFVRDPDLAPRMGRQARRIAEDRYDVRKVNAVMLREMGMAPIVRDGPTMG
ncbi:glycosyltransferase family 4 protein [Arenimonas composti]|uniref:Glycosyltransferase subfamily 4-like N-terminal domain-containing protein n=1 Tax=Arenimonas composti TR7-09 = DSM 18010 TaxID=1121013 RepID=A0A091BIX5_9GAMM|nr:glycosyltransferase family 4 protein [Arenimonas composti]KFN51437.1 hypothetical protein P873_02575 [Arenimonas composti TR7-09 = DSM 18010]